MPCRSLKVVGDIVAPLHVHSYDGYFSHFGYESTARPADLSQKLEASTEFRAEIRTRLPGESSRRTTVYERVACKGPLLKPDIRFERQDGGYAPDE